MSTSTTFPVPEYRAVAPRRRPALIFLSTWLALLGALGSFAAAEPARIVLFDFELADGGVPSDPTGMTALGAAMLQGRGPGEADKRRLALVSEELRRLVAARAEFAVVDLAPIAGKLAEAAPLAKCNGCDTDLARAVGADLAVLGRVQKLTPVLVHIDLTVKDVAADRPVRAVSVDVNGDTDESWLRGVRWLFRNRLVEPPLVPAR